LENCIARVPSEATSGITRINAHENELSTDIEWGSSITKPGFIFSSEIRAHSRDA